MKVGFTGGIHSILLGCSRHPLILSPTRTPKGTSVVLFGNLRHCLVQNDRPDCDQSMMMPTPLSSLSITNNFGSSSNAGNSYNNLSVSTCVIESFLASLTFFIMVTAITTLVPLSAFARDSVENNNQNYGSSTIPSTTSTTKSPTENYLPRRLYPGTYKNYCGPTPEVTVRDGCKAHGWHGDEPLDLVDSTCRLHDISYCQCETQLILRKNSRSRQNQQPTHQANHNSNSNNNNVDTLDNNMEILNDIPLLSALVALRFVTEPVLTQTQTVDMEYLNCIHKADTELIASGVRIRRQQQQTGCQSTTTDTLENSSSSSSNEDPSSLNWFCKDVRTGDSSKSNAKEKRGLVRLWSNKNNPYEWKDDDALEQQDKTLSTFENVNMYIFLKNLDSDEHHKNDDTTAAAVAHRHPRSSTGTPTFTQLEKQRHNDLVQEIKSGKTVADAASSPLVEQDEEQLLQKLLLRQDSFVYQAK